VLERRTSVENVGYCNVNLEWRTVKRANFNTLDKYVLHAVIEELLASDDGQSFWNQIILVAILQELQVPR